jgi:2-polyprenyl-6-methoxyphenol hydroxylase-like FAD-dependent oxidoreductase
MDSFSRVIIIGGGIGGLALAQGLKKSGVPFHVFEQDPTPDFRAQGYRLKLNSDGCKALNDVLSDSLWLQFQDTCAVCEEGETNFDAIAGTTIASRAGPRRTRGGAVIKTQTCDRTVLRNILLSGLDDNISFGKSLLEYTTTENGKIVAKFADGSSENGTLLVGADGIHSRIRKQYLPSHRPLDTNGSCIYGKTPLTPELLEIFPKRATKWMTLIIDRTPMTQTLDVDETPLTLLLEPIRFANNSHRKDLPADYIYWVLISRTDVFETHTKELLYLNGEDSAKLSLNLTQEWDPSFRVLFYLQDSSQTSTLRVSSAFPKIVPWEPSANVTLLGDAIHVMSPSGGVGAATALRDAALLSNTISKFGISASTIGKYEATMRIYAQASIERSYFGGKKMFGQEPFEKCKPLEI